MPVYKANLLILVLLSIVTTTSVFGVLYYIDITLKNFNALSFQHIPLDAGDTESFSGEIKIDKNPIDAVKLSAKENFDRMVAQGNQKSSFPKIQPVLQGTYVQNTAKMTNYMKTASFNIVLDKPVSEGYLYFKIKLQPNLTQNSTTGKLFIYLSRSNFSGYIDSSTAVYSFYDSKNKTWELIFDAKKIGVLPWKEFQKTNINLIEKLYFYGNNNYISTFWVSNHASTIEEIVFAYDY